jgi:hypothetical protein
MSALPRSDNLKKSGAAIFLFALLLTGCNSGEAATLSGSTSATSAQAAPDIVGNTLGEAATALAISGVDYDYYQDGKKLSVGVAELKALIVASTEPRAGATIPAGSRLRINAAPKPTTSASSFAAEPATLQGALAAANKDHTDMFKAIGAMEDLYRQAQKSLKPNMADGAWGKLEIIRINTTLGALNETLTVREVVVGVKQYTATVEAEAARQKQA